LGNKARTTGVLKCTPSTVKIRGSARRQGAQQRAFDG
jgi:hypothetical protein